MRVDNDNWWFGFLLINNSSLEYADSTCPGFKDGGNLQDFMLKYQINHNKKSLNKSQRC